MQQATLFETDGFMAGVDEAGRGPLAGPVVAAAVILDPRRPIAGLADSKKLTQKRRDTLSLDIMRDARCWSVAWADAAEIDAVNVLAATMLAMRRAIIGLAITPASVRIDGNRLPDLSFDGRLLQGEAVIGGDARVAAISAASILAKTTRDRMMLGLDRLYPCYGFAQHKGYPTALHRQKLRQYGPCCEHRRSFAPVRAVS